MQLERTEGKTSEVLSAGKQMAISRHLSNLKELLTEVDKARRMLEAQKIANKLDDKEISEWNDRVNAKIEEADGRIEVLEEWLAKRKMELETQEREEKLQLEIKLHETELKLQQEFQAKTKTHPLMKRLPVKQNYPSL